MVSKPTKKIVFYRIGAIGDIIHTLPLIKLTRELNPQARIEYIIGSDQVKSLLDQYADYIDKVHFVRHGSIFDKPAKLFPSKEDKVLIEELNKDTVDDFVYLHTNKVKAKLLNSRVIKAKKLLIYQKDESLSAVANYVSSVYPEFKDDLSEDPHRVLDYRTLVSSKEIASPSARNDISKNISIVLGVGKLRPTRAYPLLSWIRFIETILSDTDYEINILGGPDEKELSEEFEYQLQLREESLNYLWLKEKPDYSRIKNKIGKTSLLELATILKNTDRVFSADTGILHVAAALDLPISSVFSITSENRFGPFSQKAAVLRSGKCACTKANSNLPKHCSSPSLGYASCMYDLDFS